MLKPIKTLIYKPISEEAFEEQLIRKREKGDNLKWRRVEFSFTENKMRGNFQICGQNIGQTRRYKLAKTCGFPWNDQGLPSGGTFEYAKDDKFEYFRMIRTGKVVTNVFKIMKKS